MLACLGLRELRSNDLFGRANQRAVGLIGRVAPRNSPYGRAQRGRTLKLWGASAIARSVPHERLVRHYFAGHVLVHTTYDSLQARSVSVLKPI